MATHKTPCSKRSWKIFNPKPHQNQKSAAAPAEKLGFSGGLFFK